MTSAAAPAAASTLPALRMAPPSVVRPGQPAATGIPSTIAMPRRSVSSAHDQVPGSESTIVYVPAGMVTLGVAYQLAFGTPPWPSVPARRPRAVDGAVGALQPDGAGRRSLVEVVVREDRRQVRRRVEGEDRRLRAGRWTRPRWTSPRTAPEAHPADARRRPSPRGSAGQRGGCGRGGCRRGGRGCRGRAGRASRQRPGSTTTPAIPAGAGSPVAASRCASGAGRPGEQAVGGGIDHREVVDDAVTRTDADGALRLPALPFRARCTSSRGQGQVRL